MIMRQPILYVCAYDASLDFDKPYIYVFSTYARALRHACDEIRDRLVDEASLELADEIGALLNEGRLDETLEAYADGSEPGRYVIIEERLVDPEAIEHAEDSGPELPAVTYREEPAHEGDRFIPIVWQGLAATIAATRSYERGNVLRGDSMIPATRYPDGRVMVYDAIVADLPYAADPVVTVTPVRKAYVAPSVRKIDPSEAIRAAFGPPQTTEVEVRAEILTAARAILAEHAAARQLGRADALHHCHEAAMQLTIAIRDYLENAP
jgi:hypothetical protein